MTEKSSWLIDIPSQGVHIASQGKDQILKFFNQEIAFYNALGVSGYNIQFANTGYGSVELTSVAVQELSQIIDEIQKDKTAAFERYLEDAKTNQILVGASPVGRRLGQLKNSESGSSAQMMACILSPKW